MSKAFTRESDHEREEDAEPQPLPVGVKNYITPAGLERLRGELHHLRRVERPKVVEIVAWAAGNGDRSENGDYIYGKRRLREIDRRIRFLLKRLEIAIVVDPALQKNREQVFFGATVTYLRGEEVEPRKLRIIGIDEADLARGEVSWIAPIARALLKARVGDLVELRAESGSVTLEVIDIAY